MAANSRAQGFDHLPQFGLASKAILGGIKRELGLEGFAILAADRTGQTEELPQRKLGDASCFLRSGIRQPQWWRSDIGAKRRNIVGLAELRGAIVRGHDGRVLWACYRAASWSRSQCAAESRFVNCVDQITLACILILYAPIFKL
jgi:hypothetical protein